MVKLSSPALDKERKRLEDDFATRLIAEKEVARQRAEKDLRREIFEAKKAVQDAEKEKRESIKALEAELEKQLASAREVARREAERDIKVELQKLRKEKGIAEAEAKKNVQRAQAEAEKRLQRQMADEIRRTTEQNEIKLEKVELERQRDRTRHEAEIAKLQTLTDNLSRKLEKQSGEQLGSEAELDLLNELRSTFRNDIIDRIGKGKKGADILHRVMDGENEVGRIVYESKNVSTWQNAFVTQADRYRAQYETPYVLIVSRMFPKKEKDFCIAGGIPVVRPALAMSLACVMREAILEIGKLRLSGAGKDQKAHQLIDYIVSDRFTTRFREIAEAISSLKEQQRKERNWHENAWENQSSLHDRIDKSHREIGAQIGSVLKHTVESKKPLRFAAKV